MHHLPFLHPRLVQILILLGLALLLRRSLLAILRLESNDNDEQRLVSRTVLHDISDRVRTISQQEQGESAFLAHSNI